MGKDVVQAKVRRLRSDHALCLGRLLLGVAWHGRTRLDILCDWPVLLAAISCPPRNSLRSCSRRRLDRDVIVKLTRCDEVSTIDPSRFGQLTQLDLIQQYIVAKAIHPFEEWKSGR